MARSNIEIQMPATATSKELEQPHLFIPLRKGIGSVVRQGHYNERLVAVAGEISSSLLVGRPGYSAVWQGPEFSQI